MKRNRMEQIKYEAHKNVTNAINKGVLVKQPCVICGEKEVDAHHHNYKKPLDVVWLCKEHHCMVHSHQNRYKMDRCVKNVLPPKTSGKYYPGALLKSCEMDIIQGLSKGTNINRGHLLGMMIKYMLKNHSDIINSWTINTKYQDI
jgi:hypothetical protein